MNLRHILTSGCMILALLTITACDQKKHSITSHTWIERNNAFSLRIFKQIIKDDSTNHNLLIAGPSISTVGSMLWLGSERTTKQQLASTLFGTTDIDSDDLCQFYQQHSNTDTNIKQANAIWINPKHQLTPAYKREAKSCMAVDLFNDTIEASKVNAWAKRNTDGMITNLISPGDIKNAAMVLANTLFFKGQWQTAFDPSQTKLDAFWPRNIQANERLAPDEVNTMSALSDHYQYTANKRWQVLAMPFKDNKQQMVVFLPQACQAPRCQLAEQLHDMSFDTFKGLLTALKPLPPRTQIRLQMPSFSFEDEHQLIGPLESMGIHDLFSPNKADLSRMLITPRHSAKPYVSLFKQKSKIIVNEQGAKAAAATSAVIGLTAVREDNPPKIIGFNANHPFMFMITDQQGQVLFIGRYSGPAR
jgi:serpin B